MSSAVQSSGAVARNQAIMSIEERDRFLIDPGFIARFKGKQPEWGPVGFVTFKRTYARPLPDGKTEDYWQTLERIVNGVYTVQRWHCRMNNLPWRWGKAQRSAQRMFQLMWDFKFLPGGRGLWMMGTTYVEERGSASLNNCFIGSERLLTKFGALSFSEAAGQQVEVLTREGWAEAEVRAFGTQKVQRVTFAPAMPHPKSGWRAMRSNLRHTMTVTPNHRWILADGDETTALAVGDFVPAQASRDAEQNEGYKFGFRHGLVFADGAAGYKHISGNTRAYHVRLCGDKRQHAALFENVTYPESYGGDAYAHIISDVDLKRPPTASWSSSPDHVRGFIDGWLAGDGSLKPGGAYALGTQDSVAAQWVIEHAALGGYIITGDNTSSVVETNFGVRAAPLRAITLSKESVAWKVVAIEHLDEEEQVYCAVVPSVGSFTLANGIYTGNCSFVSTENIDKEFSEPFTFLMDFSMLGVGVGGDCNGAGKVTIRRPVQGTDVHLVPDTREGWISLARRYLDAYVGIGSLPASVDYSLIRPYGAPIKGFGGTAAGPAPLIRLVGEIQRILNKLIDKLITSEAIVDLFDVIGVCVVAGNVRRSAIIMFGEPDDKDFLNLKNPEVAKDSMMTHRWASNNSIRAKIGMDYTDASAILARAGEPGFLWLENATKWGRTGDTMDDARASGTNPCQPGWATVLTPNGITTFDNIGVGSTIWSGQRWTKVVKKVPTGSKPVYAFKTRAGVFYGTENHRVVQDGEKIEVGQAEAIDTSVCAGAQFDSQEAALDPQDVMDGLILGDGMVHKASPGLPPLLLVGSKDQDYFTNADLAPLFIENRDGVKTGAWLVKTTLLREEVPKTYVRKVPDRFLHGEAAKVRGFLRGLYSANGSVVANRVTLKAASYAVIEAVQQMLSTLGIRSYYTVNRAHEVEFENGTYECRESYDLNISTDRAAFAQAVGFIQRDKQNRLYEACERPTHPGRTKTTFEIVERALLGDEAVYDITVDAPEHTYWTGGLLVSNCGEIVLEPYELCNLCETFPSRHATYEDYRITLKHAYLYAKTVSLIPTHNTRTNAVMLRNRRIGISQSGIIQSFVRHGRRNHLSWCERGYDYIGELDHVYSEWLCVRQSKRRTTVKPSGTVSLLPGVTPGIHYEHAEYYYRTIRVAVGSPLVAQHRAAGYRVELDKYDSSGKTAVIYFPIKAPFFDRSKDDVTMWEQLENAAAMQECWSDNSVSITVTFKPHEAKDLPRALELFESRLKTVSFLPLEEHGYDQAPYITITKDEFDRASAAIKVADLSMAGHDEAATPKFCDGDVCMVPSLVGRKTKSDQVLL